jgi:hypothetical protein
MTAKAGGGSLVPAPTLLVNAGKRDVYRGMSDYRALLDRVEGLCALLAGEERVNAERVVAACRELDGRERLDGKLVSTTWDNELKRELARLAELLGRRTAQALPAATLGRAALADLAGDTVSVRALRADCDAKLRMLGH